MCASSGAFSLPPVLPSCQTFAPGPVVSAVASPVDSTVVGEPDSPCSWGYGSGYGDSSEGEQPKSPARADSERGASRGACVPDLLSSVSGPSTVGLPDLCVAHWWEWEVMLLVLLLGAPPPQVPKVTWMRRLLLLSRSLPSLAPRIV